MRKLLLAAFLACSVPLTACVTSPQTAEVSSARQKTIDATYNAYAMLNQAILATDAAVKAGTIKQADAAKAVGGFYAAKQGLDVALNALVVTEPAPAASGVK